MICPYCHYDVLPNDANFCLKCGKPLPQPLSAPTPMEIRAAPAADIVAAHQSELFFGEIVASYLKPQNPRFLRRDWLADEVETRLRDPDCRFLLLTGEPGAGKSAFMAQLAADHPDWLVYFIRRNQVTPLDVGDHSFLLQIGYQLAALYPTLFTREYVQLIVEQHIETVAEQGQAIGAQIERMLASPFYRQVIRIRQQATTVQGNLTGLRIKEFAVSPRDVPVENLQHMALLDPARALMLEDPHRHLVILIDGLDELRYHPGGATIMDWLSGLSDKLPANLRFVLTSRPPEGALVTFIEQRSAQLRRLTITSDDTRVTRDLHTYVQQIVAMPQVVPLLAARKEGAEGFVAEAVAMADGNIGYLDALARGIDQALLKDGHPGLEELLALRQLPDDIQGLYAFFLHQIATQVKDQSIQYEDSKTGEPQWLKLWPDVCQRLLGVLSVATAPLGVDQLRRLGSILPERDRVVEALGWLRQFLDEPGGGYRLYHQTVAEFLGSERTRDHPDWQDLYAEPLRWHRQIAKFYWRQHHEDWRNCTDPYGLNNLAFHLDRAGDHERLAQLICQEWMAARFDGSGSTYDGFIADLTLAWQHAHSVLGLQIDSNEEPDRLVTCMRYLLIRSSINALAGTYVPDLVIHAVRAGVWPVERALSLGQLIPDPGRRSELFAALLDTQLLAAPQRVHAEEEALAAAQLIDEEGERARVLANLVSVLTGDTRDIALRAAQAYVSMNHNSWAWTYVLPKVAPLLADTDREVVLCTALTATAAIEQEFFRRDALVALAPQLTGESLHDGLAAALAINDKWDRTKVLVALAPQLKGELLHDALTAALVINGKWDRRDVLIALAPQLNGDLLRDALSTILESVDSWDRAEVLVALAPQLNGDLLRDALAAAHDIADSWKRAEVLATLALQSSCEERAKILDEARTAAQADRNQLSGARARTTLETQLGSPAVDVLAPHLPGTLLQDEASVAQALNAEYLPTQVRAILAPPFTIEELSGAFDSVLATMESFADERDRAKGLGTLAAMYRGEQRATALHKALATTQAIADEKVRTKVLMELMVLAPLLTGDQLRDFLAAAREIVNQCQRAEALATLALQMSGEERAGALKEALTVTLAIPDDQARATALAALMLRLTGEERADALKEALAVTRAITDKQVRASALAALALQLNGEERTGALKAALGAALAILDQRERANTLADLAPQLTGGLLAICLSAALAITDEDLRARVLLALAPQLTGDLLGEGLAAALGITNECCRLEVQAALVSQLAIEERPVTLRSLLTSTSAIVGEEERARVLIALAPQLTGDLLQEGLSIAHAIAGDLPRANALTALVPGMTGKGRAEALQGALEASAAYGNEQIIMQTLCALAPHLTENLLQYGLATTRQIQNVFLRVVCLASLAPQLHGDERLITLTEAFTAAQAMDDLWSLRTSLLSALAPQLTGDLLRDGLASAQAINDSGTRAATLAAFLPASEDQSSLLRDIRHAITDHLRESLASRQRQDVLEFIAQSHLFAPPILSPTILAAIAEQMIEICDRWVWL